MDHLAVARGCDGADRFRRFQDDDLAAGLGKPAGDGKSDHSRTDHHAINTIHRLFNSRLSPISIPTPRPMAQEPARDEPSSHCIALFGLNLSKNRRDRLETDRKSRRALAKH
jgi:hypothetical protein